MTRVLVCKISVTIQLVAGIVQFNGGSSITNNPSFMFSWVYLKSYIVYSAVSKDIVMLYFLVEPFKEAEISFKITWLTQCYLILQFITI